MLHRAEANGRNHEPPRCGGRHACAPYLSLSSLQPRASRARVSVLGAPPVPRNMNLARGDVNWYVRALASRAVAGGTKSCRLRFRFTGKRSRAVAALRIGAGGGVVNAIARVTAEREVRGATRWRGR